jgi:hypothetical protein
MRHRRRTRTSTWLARAIAVTAVQWSIVFAQIDQAGTNRRETVAQDQPATALPPVPIALPQRPGQAEQELKEIRQGKRESFQTILISELHFCRSACGLTKEQGQTIAKRAGVAIEQAIAHSAGLYLNIAKRGGIQLASEPAPPNPVKLVRETLRKLVIEYATPAQQARYQAECEQRAAHRRETAIHGLVARLDRMLILSSSQRERLLRLFESNWNDEWRALGSVMGDDDGPMVAIPDRLIVPCLSPAQRKVWNKLDKQGIDATEDYLAVVTEIMEGLPSEFTTCLDAATPHGQGAPAEEMKRVDAKKDRAK